MHASLEWHVPGTPGMHLSDHDLRQIDEAALANLTPEQARALLSKAIVDLKRARERLAQNPSNSSRPPSTRAPWEQSEAQEPEEVPIASTQSVEEEQSGAESEQKEPQTSPEGKQAKKPAGRPGRRKGAAGYSRTQQRPVDAEQTHSPPLLCHLRRVLGCLAPEPRA